MGKFSLYSIFKAILSKKNRIYLTLFLLITGIFTLVYYSNRWFSNQSISKIIVIGNKLLSKNEILSSLDNSILHLKNKDIQLLKIKSEIESNPYISKAYVMRKNLTQIVVDVREREPIAILVGTNGELHFVDKNAVELPYRILPYLKDMPLIRNVFYSNTLRENALKGAIDLLKAIKNENNSSLAKFISDIIYDPNSKNYSCLTSVDFCKIIIGKANNIQRKIDLLNSFWENKLTALDMRKIKYIDLRWKNRVVVKFLT